MTFNELPIETESQRFSEHLKLVNNTRIIFSGIFGIGKTYFIEKFFRPDSEEYITIKLNPINYSISSNDDIFELIKFDIGFELLSKNPEFEKISFDFKSVSELYLIENFENIIKELIENLPKLNHRLDQVIKPITKLHQEVKKFKGDIEVDEGKELKDFLKAFSLKKGTNREENSITQLLRKLVESLKASEPKKEVILLIDDLDRIDPEHIFRIMNVFSAHFDHYDQKGENKFDFDKIILVCDINNIRGIFHNRYGSEVDFTGYIDKFYSNEIFEYNFSEIINQHLSDFLDSIKENSGGLKASDIKTGFIADDLEFLLSCLVKTNSLSMRGLLNFLKSDLVIPKHQIKMDMIGTGNIYSHKTPIILIFYLLEKIIGGRNNLEKAIDKLISYKPIIELSIYHNYSDIKIGNLAMLSDIKNSNLSISVEPYIFQNENLDLKIIYHIDHFANYSGVYGKALRVGHFEDNIENEPYELKNKFLKTKIPYFQLLKLAYSNLNYVLKDSI